MAEETSADSLSLGLATDTPTFEQAFSLVHDQYVESGYMSLHRTGWRLNLYNGIPSTKTFVARGGGRVVGTVTLVPDSTLGLPMDEIYQEEIDALRVQGRTLAEVSALAIDPAWRHLGVGVTMRLVRMIVLYAAEVAGLDDLCVAVNPRHVAFYTKGLHFRHIGGLKHYRKVNGAPAVALRLDLSLARNLVRELRKEHPRAQEQELYRFLFGPESYREALDQILADLPHSSLSPEQFAYFFGDHEALREAAPEHRRFVESFYEDAGLGTMARALVHSLGELLKGPDRLLVEAL